MLFSQAQQKVMNLACDVLSETKKSQEKYKAQGLGDDCGYDEQERIFLLSDGVAIKVTVKAETVTVVKE